MKTLLTACLIWTTLATSATALPAEDQVRQAYSYIDQWRIEEAETLTQELLKNHPESGDVHFLNARVQFYKGRYRYAQKILQGVDDNSQMVKAFKKLVNNTVEAAGDFVSEESEHFIYRYRDGRDQILVHYAREVLERSYKVLGDLFDTRPKGKILVEFYPDREPFSRISPLTMQDIVTSGTVALCKYNRLMIISPASLVRGYNWMDTLSHEFVHYLMAKKTHNNLPLWLNEGVAKYFESRWREDDSASLAPVMETVLARALANDYLVRLEDMTPSLAKLKKAEDVHLAYAQVATMVDYLVSIIGEKNLPAFLEALGNDLPFPAALGKYTGKTLAQFQTDWRAFVKNKKLTVIPGLKVLAFKFKNDRDALQDEKDYDEIETRSSRDKAFLGDILKSRNYIQAAILEYQKAIEESPTLSPILHNKLAATQILVKEYGRAETLLQESLRYYPEFHTTQTNLGELYFIKEDYERAEEYFEKAVRLNPFNPLVRQRLIAVNKKLGRDAMVQLQVKLFRQIE